MKSIYNRIKYKLKMFFGLKNIILTILTFSVIFLIVSVFRYIHLQNIQYQDLSEETNIRQQSESAEEESLTEMATPPEIKEQKQEVEREYRDDTLMIF